MARPNEVVDRDFEWTLARLLVASSTYMRTNRDESDQHTYKHYYVQACIFLDFIFDTVKVALTTATITLIFLFIDPLFKYTIFIYSYYRVHYSGN